MRDTSPRLAEYDPDEIVTIPTVKKRTHLDRPIDRAVIAGQLRLLPGGWRRVRWGDVVELLRSGLERPTPHAEDRLREVLERENAA